MNAPHLENGLIDVTPTRDYLAITKANAANSPLLRLPAELRAKIWEYAVDGHTIRPYICKEAWGLLNATKITLARPYIHRFSLLRICRQIYTETAILPYALSTFSNMRYPDVLNWIRSMPPHKRELVQNISKLRFQYHSCLDPNVLRKTFPTLKKLSLLLDIGLGANMDEKERGEYELRFGVAIELIYSECCDWMTQWASGDLNAKCRTCIEIERLAELEAEDSEVKESEDD